MNKHLKYLNYVIRHKWFVFIECCKLKMLVRGILHDWSKLLPSEWNAYTEYFYGKDNTQKEVKDDFDSAWLKHQNRNKHHWQYWILITDDGKDWGGKTRCLDIPDNYIKEMVADWKGAGRALGKTNEDEAAGWYINRSDSILLSYNTRKRVNELLGIGN